MQANRVVLCSSTNAKTSAMVLWCYGCYESLHSAKNQSLVLLMLLGEYLLEVSQQRPRWHINSGSYDCHKFPH
jgi:hypothetical protein